MHKLLRGMFEFQRGLTAAKRTELSRLALGQRPDAYLLTCCDSRVAPNSFASTQPGDVYVPRNPGNLVPRFRPFQKRDAPRAVGASLEHAVVELKVDHVIVCGHSECGVMIRALKPRRPWKTMPNFSHWLDQVVPSIRTLAEHPEFARQWAQHNRLSQWSVIAQLDNLMTYPVIARRVNRGALRLHGWFFDLHQWRVLGLTAERDRFVEIDHQYIREHNL